MALSLAKGEAPSRAVQIWRESVHPLVGLLRARRRQTMLLFDQTFANAPAACAAALGLPAPEGADVPRPETDPVLIMIAREALRADFAAQALVEELVATAFSPDEGEEAEDFDLVFETYIKGLQQQTSAEAGRAEALARVAALETEATKLRKTLQDAAKTAEAALAAERARAAEAEAAISATLAATEAEAALLRDQLRLDSAALEQSQAAFLSEQNSRQAAEAGRADALARVAALEAEATKLRKTLQDAAKTAEAVLAAERARAAEAEAAINATLAATEAEADLLRDQLRLDGEVMEQMQTALLAERDKAATLEAGHAADRAQAHALIEAERAASAKTRTDLNEMIHQLQTQVQHAGQALETALAQVDSLQADRSALLVQIAQLRAARADLEGYYDHAKQSSEQLGVLTTDLEGLQSALQMAQAEAAERAQHVAWLEEEIGRIHGSRSYRLTNPLRKLRKTLG